jgi:DNA invertase Pin-like site-specific DNA recombinase
MEMLSVLKDKQVDVYDVKNGWELNGSLQSEVMAFAFSIAARIERELLLQRCKEGREAAKARGVKFGRPKGPGSSKLDKYEEEIVALLKTGSRQNFIAKKYGTTPANLSLWLKKKSLKDVRPSNFLNWNIPWVQKRTKSSFKFHPRIWYLFGTFF